MKMRFMFITALFAGLFSTVAQANLFDRMGPIFSMEKIPFQKDLLKSYFIYNTQRAAIAASSHHYFKTVYRLLNEDDFSVFSSRVYRHTPNLDFSLAFQNHNMGIEDPEHKVDQYGHCIGVTTVLRKMNLLAFYDPENSYGAEVPDKQKDPQGWLKFYENIVDRIMSNRPAIIPYFSNLHEFSGTPGIKDRMVRHVLNEWGLNDATLYGGFLQMLLGTKRHFSKSEGDKLYKKLRKRIDRGYPPRVFLSNYNKKKLFGAQYIHIMQVFDLTKIREDGSYEIGVWHINNTWDKATYYIKVTADGHAFMEWRDLGDLDLVPWDDAEVGEMVKNLKPFCSKHEELCY